MRMYARPRVRRDIHHNGSLGARQDLQTYALSS